NLQAGDARERLDSRSALARAVGIAPEERPGEHHAVVRVPGGGEKTGRVQLRDQRSRLAGIDEARGEPVALVQLHARLDAGHRLPIVREEDVSAAPEPDVDAQL